MQSVRWRLALLSAVIWLCMHCQRVTDEAACVICAGLANVVDLLANSGRDVNTQRPDGITALMIACRMVCSCAVYLTPFSFCDIR